MNWLFKESHPVTCDFAGHLQRTPPSQAPGIDIGAAVGTVVHAPAPGKVLDVRWSDGGGLNLWIAHPGQVQSYYAHLQSVFVGRGQQVKQGQPIAQVGITGHSTGPHLHFSLKRKGEWVDPAPVLEPKEPVLV